MSLEYAPKSRPFPSPDHPSLGLHVLALLTAAATLVLIFMGGLVTSHKAGMSVPDWPNSFGYNMFLLPPSVWLSKQAGGVFYEHSHRLMGALVGFLSIGLVVWSWRAKASLAVRWLAVIILAAVIFQGVLGGLRVVFVELRLAVIHGCFAQAFFCATAIMAVVTSRAWRDVVPVSNADWLRKTAKWAVIAASIVYGQLILGALMRHYDAGLAIPDFPLAYGKLLPPLTLDDAARANWDRTMVYKLPQHMSLLQMWLHFGHRIGAAVVTIALLWLAAVVVSRHRRDLWLVRPAWALLVLLTAQVTLGICTVMYRKPADVASAHVAVGALVLMTTVVIAVRACRLAYLAEPPEPNLDRSVERARLFPADVDPRLNRVATV